MTNESETTNPGGTKGPCLHVPVGWLLGEALGSFSHEKRKYMMLILLAAKEVSGTSVSGTWDTLNLYGESSDEYGGNSGTAMDPIGYIKIEGDFIYLTEETRQLFGMEEFE